MSSEKLLTKSRFVKGLRCEKLLWLSVHEPDADELLVSPAMQLRFDTGHLIGERARLSFPAGVLIPKFENDIKSSIDMTRKALSEGAGCIFEAAFRHEKLYCAIDVLERTSDGFRIIEVKSSTKLKDEYIADAAFQTFVAKKSGIRVHTVEIMVLNRDCRYPDLSNLFKRIEVTREVLDFLEGIGDDVDRILMNMNTPQLPLSDRGPHCSEPHVCPFFDRCHQHLPEHYVDTLYMVKASTVDALLAMGCEVLSDLDEESRTSAIQRRQVRAVKKNQMIVEAGLGQCLSLFQGPFGFLDFETVAPAIPVWNACRPYDAVPVQFSYHYERSGELAHAAWIVTGAGDPRRGLAEALIESCQEARTIFAYNANFEKQCIKGLARELSDLEAELMRIHDRIEDLLPVVRNYVYHPEFYGGFGLKVVLPLLCPDLSYQGLAITNGEVASQLLESIACGTAVWTDGEREKVLCDLRAYCELDTLGLVRLYQRLCDLGRL
jgi:hypothetical protein